MSKIKFLLFLFCLGIFLYYFGKPEPLKSLKSDFNKILGNSSKKEKEPWTREGREDTVASDNGSFQSKIEDAVSAIEGVDVVSSSSQENDMKPSCAFHEGKFHGMKRLFLRRI